MRKAFVSMVLVALTSTVASGYTITQTQNYGGIPDYNQVLTFNQFDDMGGTRTLQSVYVEVNLTANGGALRCDNDAVTPASGAIEFGAQVAVSSSVSMIDALFQPIFQAGDVKATGGTSMNLAADDGDGEVGGTPNFSYTGPDYDEYLGGAVSDGDSGIVNPVVYFQYIGLGTFTVTLDSSQVANYGSLGGVQAMIDPLTTTGTVKIIYTYVPEPAALGLLAAGGLMIIRRRRLA